VEGREAREVETPERRVDGAGHERHLVRRRLHLWKENTAKTRQLAVRGRPVSVSDSFVYPLAVSSQIVDS